MIETVCQVMDGFAAADPEWLAAPAKLEFIERYGLLPYTLRLPDSRLGCRGRTKADDLPPMALLF